MYEVLVEMVEPQVEEEMTQQTPKPAAQEPEAAPPLLPHSEVVKQVPLVLVLPLVHSSLGNWTTLNKENCSSWRRISLVNSNHIIYFSLCPQ